ncbi:MAG TPA: DNA repair protein RecN [Actinomycetota bacterium]|nr:DNA repair protein RecN [Actinomycetota bacterium]
MLRELHISGLGVIDDLDLEFDGGLTVLTGETGAGKTMVTVGLSLALGARGAATLVRAGAGAARVQARFDVPPPLAAWAEDGEVVLARTIRVDGRGGARVGGEIATVSTLAALGDALVEVHGQHQTLRLLETATQTAFLDRVGGADHLEAVAAHRSAYERLTNARAARDELVEAARERERALDLLAYQVQEIDDVGPRADETDDLVAEEARLAHVERLLELTAEAAAAASSDGGAADLAATVSAALAAAAELDRAAEPLATRAASLAAELVELAHDVRTHRDSLADDPARLDAVRDRLAALRSLQRRYGATDLDVIAFRDRAAGEMARLAGADERLLRLDDEVSALEGEVAERARAVSEGRAATAPVLAASLTEQLHELGMPAAAAEVSLVPLPAPGADGAERIELRLVPGPGQPALPLAKGASGGELSRVMLACRSVVADVDDVATIVFDEIDAGIGGEAGLAVGRRLAALAARRQVIVVTHLPQIACFADRHVRVRKHDGVATVEVLDDDERVRELSRMLAGLEASEAAVTHAEELLAEAERARS